MICCAAVFILFFMKTIDIIAPGRMKKSLFEPLFADYQKRLGWGVVLHEIESKHTLPEKIRADEHAQILGKLKPGAFVVALDERGKSLKSLEFADIFRDLQSRGQNHMQCVLGGADGLSDDIRGRADLLLSFGRQTWPHMLARVMLLEQIYRGQQILGGHPYHRE